MNPVRLTKPPENPMIKYTQRKLTPEDASKLLAYNIDNRALRSGVVERLANCIRAGQWQLTHQGIAIAESGRILDGQHRLHAIVQAGKPVDIMVATGLDESAFRWIDCGIQRQASDRLHLFDAPGINKRAVSIVNQYLQYGVGNHRPTVVDIETCFHELADSVTYVASAFATRVQFVTSAPVGAALVCFHTHNPDDAILATEALLMGQGLNKGDPLLILRESLLNRRIRSDPDAYWKTIQACKVHETNSKITRLDCARTDFRGNVFGRREREIIKLAKLGGQATKAKRRAEKAGGK